MTETAGKKTIDDLEPIVIPGNLDGLRIPVNANGVTGRITAQQLLDITAQQVLDVLENLESKVGKIIIYGGAVAPAGWLICDGSALSRTNYARLFNVIGVRFGNGDGANTFNIPNLMNRMPLGANSTDKLLGSNKSAGLPNITAAVDGVGGNAGANIYRSPSGAFYTSLNVHFLANPGAATTDHFTLLFDASRSNVIYGNSSTVQPPATCVNFIIKY